MSRYIITINRDKIEKGQRDPIRVEDTLRNRIFECDLLELPGPTKIVSGPQRQDGARVWIEADKL